MPDTRIDPRPLLAAAALAVVLSWVGVLPAWAGLPHAVALPPLDLVADLRVLLARATSWPAFVLGLGLSLGARSVILAAVLSDRSRGGLARALRFYLLAMVPAWAAAALAYASLAVVYAPFFWVALALIAALSLLLAPVPWVGWRVRPALAGAYLLALAGVSLLAAADHWTARAVATFLSAAVTAAAAVRLRGSRPGREPRTAGARALPVAVAGVTLALLVVPVTDDPPAGRDGSLLLVAGVSTASGRGAMFRLDPSRLGYSCDQTVYFSYRGPGPGAPQRDARCPIRAGAPYTVRDSQRSLASLVDAFRAQVMALDPPVAVVTHSQGAWVVTDAIRRFGPLGIDAVAMFGPFPTHPVAYLPPGRDGPGRVGSESLRALFWALELAWGTGFDPGAPLALSTLASPRAIDELFERDLPVPVLTVTSWLDLPVMPDGWAVPGAANACPLFVYHGHLPASAAVAGLVARFLDGERPGPCPWWRRVPAPAAEAFGVPAPRD